MKISETTLNFLGTINGNISVYYDTTIDPQIIFVGWKSTPKPEDLTPPIPSFIVEVDEELNPIPYPEELPFDRRTINFMCGGSIVINDYETFLQKYWKNER